MNQYVTGAAVKRLREKQKLTQSQLADFLGVSDRTVSKWETGRGFPDITFLEPLAKILKVSVAELFSGTEIENGNRSANLSKSNFYVCPVCGNSVFSVGKACVSCCGIQLPPLEVENEQAETEKPGLSAENPAENSGSQISENFENEFNPAENHKIDVQKDGGEIFVRMNHEMTKTHYISWFACVRLDSVEFAKMYPEQNAEARFRNAGKCRIYAHCIKHGLFEVNF
ncbi:helix-turn-helix domain-containing protein [uncultured Treponema sp.]|uniref:helix-turn-helix domain-containing protein n=1 Tax=uncultured Treponema sp. TaxID=162155 RepID=UPI0025CFDD25|nr:helix-turn-helix domain-containing protein [uncultured Treponema sp.]